MGMDRCIPAVQRTKYTVYSTGVLTREPDTISAVVNIVNLSSVISHKVIVEIWDWSSYDTPTKLTVLYYDDVAATFPYTLDPNHLAVFYADINAAEVDLYEIRIYSPSIDIVANCFGRSTPPYTSQEGNTVLNSELTQIGIYYQ